MSTRNEANVDWFALASYRSGTGGEIRPALVLDHGRIHDLAGTRDALGHDGGALDGSVDDLLADWPRTLDALRSLAAAAQARPDALTEVPGGADRLAAPYRPARIFAATSNYVDHADEMGTVLAAKANSRPYVFMKADSSVIGPGGTVELPASSEQVDWEVELAAVIGTGGRHITVDEALDHVVAYTIINDVSARDLNMRDDFPFKFDWFRGKCFDTFAPLGPWLVPAGCMPDPQSLGLRLAVNGEVMQDAKASEMIFTIAEQIAYLSEILTLRPGDLIATGTPDGVGMGRGVYLKSGDVMRAEIEAIGALENPVR
ncbi:fumarylacetoacetate hydrolase family protein [Actinomadura soli]|uniref:Fumarylacetoacetate hydrolase family protein n=1 Tax=Actinomadura soli TaxID=2508997 RepID=A0A5C4JCY7_9ACTN|nr:fumarylacetoacetate hydrolase family protein [Actinomadura soli]TMR01099.1 fumarylacetoacetate hydrolase family protein [Actinomadura soli]